MKNSTITSPAHTAGPWDVTHLENETQVFAKNRMIAAQLFDPENEPTLEELEANARLIAAAPDLLRACMALLTFAVSDAVDLQTTRKLKKILCPAIAKAGGR